MAKIRHSILMILSIVAVALAAVMVILAPHNRALAQPGHETPGFHGMLVLGGERIYASHLPMFTAQHRYQGIWQVSFGEEGDRAYREAQAASGGIFTLAPNENFRLPELVGQRSSFRVDVYQGHFERPGHRKLLDDVTVTIEQQVHWHPFLPEHVRPEQLTYILFGDGEETWLAHWISAAPDYDQIVKVSAASAEPLPSLAQVVVPEGTMRRRCGRARRSRRCSWKTAAPTRRSGSPRPTFASRSNSISSRASSRSVSWATSRANSAAVIGPIDILRNQSFPSRR